jgi:hypothetical protein
MTPATRSNERAKMTARANREVLSFSMVISFPGFYGANKKKGKTILPAIVVHCSL